MKRIKLVTACIVAGVCALLVLVLYNFKWGRRLVDWLLKLP